MKVGYESAGDLELSIPPPELASGGYGATPTTEPTQLSLRHYQIRDLIHGGRAPGEARLRFFWGETEIEDEL